jgi:hypothetical protein
MAHDRSRGDEPYHEDDERRGDDDEAELLVAAHCPRLARAR